MNAKGRKTYEAEIEILNGKVNYFKDNAVMYKAGVEALTQDFLTIISPNLFKAIIRLIRMRKQYKQTLKEHGHKKGVQGVSGEDKDVRTV